MLKYLINKIVLESYCMKEYIKKYLNNLKNQKIIKLKNMICEIVNIELDKKINRNNFCSILIMKEIDEKRANEQFAPNLLKVTTPQDTEIFSNLHKVSFLKYNDPNLVKDTDTQSKKLTKLDDGNYLSLCFDSEWYIEDNKRRILSFQFSLCYLGINYHVIIYFHDDVKITLKQCMKVLFNSLDIRDNKININLVAHFNNADLSNFLDAADIYANCSSVRKSIVTNQKPISIMISDLSKHGQKLNIHIRDTMLLSPAGSGLYDLGKAIGVEKISIGEFYIANMNKLMIDDFMLYTDYAINDSAIVLAYLKTLFNNPNQKLYVTLGGEACKLTKKYLMEINNYTNEQDFYKYFLGYETYKEIKEYNGRFITKKYYEDNHIASVLKNIAMKSYYGGRNECFTNGIWEGLTNDMDLVGAYATAMSLTPDIDYSIPPHVIHNSLLTLSIIRHDTIGFGYIKFKFPDDTMYPCIPVKDKEGRGLIYVKEGETYCTAPEVYIALLMNAKIEAVDFYFPVTVYNKNSLMSVVKYFTNLKDIAKETYGEKSVMEQKYKEMLNSIYGKFAQGLKYKKMYNLQSGETEEIGVSPISSAVIASHVTGLVRALVSGAITELYTKNRKVHSVTTDGFITDATLDDMNNLDIGGLAKYFLRARQEINPHTKTIWSQKHSQNLLVNIKTRGNIGLDYLNAENNTKNNEITKINYNLINASGGVLARNGYHMDKKDKMNGLSLAEKYLSRTGRIPNEMLILDSPKDVVNGKATGFGRVMIKMLDFEPDGKRKLDEANDIYITINGISYEACYITTLPHDNIEKFIIYKGILENNNIPIKNKIDVERINLLNYIKSDDNNKLKYNDTTYIRSVMIHYYKNNLIYKDGKKIVVKDFYNVLIEKELINLNEKQFIMLCKNCNRKERQNNYLPLELIEDYLLKLDFKKAPTIVD